MDRTEAEITKRKISIDILLREFDRAVWEIHNRAENRQRLMSLQFVFVGALTGAYATATASGRNDAELSKVLWHTIPLIIIIFSAFIIEISTQDYYRFMGASYINTYLRPKIAEITGDRDLMEWESHLRTQPECEPERNKMAQEHKEKNQKYEEPVFRNIIERRHFILNVDTIFVDLYFSLFGIVSCFGLMLCHLWGPWHREGFLGWWTRAVMGDDSIWFCARAGTWIAAAGLCAYSLWRWRGTDKLRSSIAFTSDAEEYCVIHKQRYHWFRDRRSS